MREKQVVHAGDAKARLHDLGRGVPGGVNQIELPVLDDAVARAAFLGSRGRRAHAQKDELQNGFFRTEAG